MVSNTYLLKLAKDYGCPAYVYDLNTITKKFKILLKTLPASCKIFYAAKALTNPTILNHVRSLGCNLDASSIYEVHHALKAGFLAEQIIYTSNGIHFDEIKDAIAAGVFVNIDSLSNLEKFGKYFGSTKPLGIRLRPNILDGGNLKISTGHGRSKFGIPIEQLDQILYLKEKYQLKILALHNHTGSELKLKSFSLTAALFLKLLKHFDDVKYIDFGGGFKVPYSPTDMAFSIPNLAKLILEFQEKLFKKYKKKYEFWFEPGKYLVAESGFLLAKINVIKYNPEQTIIGLNTGFNHLIRPMFYQAYHPIFPLKKRLGKSQNYTIVGNLCETDTFAENRLLSPLKENDIVAFGNAGCLRIRNG